MATHSSVFAWRIPGTGEAGRLPSMGSHRVGHDLSDLAAAAEGRVSHGNLHCYYCSSLMARYFLKQIKRDKKNSGASPSPGYPQSS